MTKEHFKWGFLAILLVASTVLTVYLSGFFFLLLNKKNPAEATLLTFYQYWYYYHSNVIYQKQLNLSALFGFAVSYGVPVFLFFVSGRKQRTLYGDARFANAAEIRQSGLLGSHGIIVGKWKDHYLTLGGQQFVLLAAPTRSGKGVGVVIPNLLNFPDSVVVLDIKLENYNATSGFRKAHGQSVYLFSPFASDLRTHRYNPLDYVRDGIFRIEDLQELAGILYPDTGGKNDNFFSEQARSFFVGLGLYLCETPELPRTLGEMLRQTSGKGKPIRDYLRDLIEERAISDHPLSSECVDAFNQLISFSDATQSSIVGSVQAPISLWRSPLVDAATSCNDFDLRKLRTKRMSLYIGINPRKVPGSSIILKLFFAQLVNLNIEELPQDNPALKYQCLLVMDEFTSMGRIPAFAEANAFIAGYNLRLLTIIQSISQLASKYGKEDAENFVTNHALQILYAPRKQKDANEYSEMLGYETVKGISRSKQTGGKGGESESQSDQKRPLLLPQEIKEIGQQKEIITLENSKPIFCHKINYLKDPVFKNRVCPAPQIPMIDLYTHQAKVQRRLRPITLDDLKDGIDLEKIAYDFSKIHQVKAKETEPDFVEEFVDHFFAGFITLTPEQADRC